MQVLLTSPEYDRYTLYLSAWSRTLVKECKNGDFKVLERKNANRKKFEGYLRKKDFDVVLLNGHGSETKVLGENGEAILDFGNIELMKGKDVHALSCRTVKQLGEAAIESGAKSYIGYDEDFVFVSDERKLSHPENDETAALFLDAAFAASKALVDGKTAHDAKAIAIKEYDRSIKKAFNSEIQSDNDQFVKYLISDRNHLVALTSN